MEKIKLKFNAWQLLLLSSFLASQLFFTNSHAGTLFKREINYNNDIRNSSILNSNKTISAPIDLNISQPTTTKQTFKPVDIVSTNLPATTISLNESWKLNDETTTVTSVDTSDNVETATELQSIFGENSLFSHIDNGSGINIFENDKKTPLATTNPTNMKLQETTPATLETTTDMFNFDYSKFLDPFNDEFNKSHQYENDFNTSNSNIPSTSATHELDFEKRHKEITQGFGDDIEFKSFQDFDLSKPTVVAEHSSEIVEKNVTRETNSTAYLDNLEVVETKYEQLSTTKGKSNQGDHNTTNSGELAGSKEVGTEKKAKFLDPAKDLRLHYPIDSSDVLNLGETYVIKHDQHSNTTQMTPTNAIDGLWAFASMMQGEKTHNKTGVYRNETSVKSSDGSNSTVKALADWMEIIKHEDFAKNSYIQSDKFNNTNQTAPLSDTHSSENRIAAVTILNSTMTTPTTEDGSNVTEAVATTTMTNSFEENSLQTDEKIVKNSKMTSSPASKYEVREVPIESDGNFTTSVSIKKETTTPTLSIKTVPITSTMPSTSKAEIEETTTEIVSASTTTTVLPSTKIPFSNNEIIEITTTSAAPVTSTIPAKRVSERTTNPEPQLQPKPTMELFTTPTTDSIDPSLNELTPKATTIKMVTSSSLPEKLETAPSTFYPTFIDVRPGATTTKMTPVDSTLEINTIDKSTESIKKNDRNVNPKINGDEYKYNTIDANGSDETTQGPSKVLEPRTNDINEHTDESPDTEPSTTAETVSPPLLDQQTPDDTDINKIIAITVSIIGFIALLLLIGFLFIMRKRQKQLNTYGQRCRPVSLDDYNLDNVSVYNSVRRKANLRMSKRSYGNSAFEDPALRSNLLTIPSLATFVQSKHSIHEEFKEIPQVTARADEVPTGCEDKNRYANVIPLPETRVHLSRQDNDEKTEYINANFVKGPKDSTNYYIATQAPMETTINDFFRMVWEQNSKVIVMATDLTENGVEKCAEYLPPSVVLDNCRTFGDYQVTLKNREVKEKYAISTIHLRNANTKTWREIVHFWYQWPDTNVPIDETSMIAMLLEARSHLKLALPEQSDNEDTNKKDSNKIIEEKEIATTKKEVEENEENAKDNNKEKDEDVKEESAKEKEAKQTNISDSKNNNYSIISNGSYDKHKSLQRMQGPLIVHCSPGTGRTGTIIACDIALRILEIPPRQIDIPQAVYYVRRGRASAVRTKEQYEFIYRVANVYATKLTGPSLEN